MDKVQSAATPQKGSVTLTSVYTSVSDSCYQEQRRRFTRLVSAQEQWGNNERTTKECADLCVYVRGKSNTVTSALNYQ